MAELKPCPFCGGDGSMSINMKEKIVFGSCWVCGARGSVIQYKGDIPSEKDIDEAQATWDRRAGDGK